MEGYQPSDNVVTQQAAPQSSMGMFTGPIVIAVAIAVGIGYLVSWGFASVASWYTSWLSSQPQTSGITQIVTYDQAWSQTGIPVWVIAGAVAFVILLILAAAAVEFMLPSNKHR